MRICEMKMKEVINICTCKKLGYVSELEVNLCTGCIEAIIVPQMGGFCGFLGKDMCYLIPYENIKKIGEDLILVEICEENCIISCKNC